MNRTDLISAIGEAIEAKSYLEIGVSKGENFRAISCERKCAVDPKFKFDWRAAAAENRGEAYFNLTSDEFFSKGVAAQGKFDLIFIDGLHTSEQTLRDFANAIDYLADGGVIVIDDVVPDSFYASMRDQAEAAAVKERLGVRGSSWMGDVYKVVLFIESFFQQYSYALPEESGKCLVVWRQPRAATDIAYRRIGDIDSTGFEDTVLKSQFYRQLSLADILTRILGQRKNAGAVQNS